MKTITFYSYKGGVGRSLALVNIATRLIEFGKKVCVIDFDLEAPGLHLKFPVYRINGNKKGIVDYVYEFSNVGKIDADIKDYSTEVPVSRSGLPLTLISAGDTESTEYWKKLSSINWYSLIYENPNGLAFFLNLKESINREINPDFLLIDSRTGISEMSGISLSLMADEVVIVAANNKENLEGAKKIIGSLNNPENNILGKIPNINFVLSRIPFTERPEDRAKEALLINRIKREYLHPHLDDISIIHSDRELEEMERVKIAYAKDESNTQISRDYLKLFEKLTKDDLSEGEIRRFNDIRQSERLMSLANSSENPSQKLELVTKAIELNQQNINLYIYRAGVHFSLQDFEATHNDIEKALSINDKHATAISLLIDVLIEENRLDEAEKKTDEYLQLKPMSIEGLSNKIQIYTKKKLFKIAEEYSSILISLDPEYSPGYSCRADARRNMKEFDKALEDVFHAFKINSEDIQAIATLAEIYAEIGRVDEFYLHLEAAIKLDAHYTEKGIKDEEIYKRFYTEPRFIALLSKYGIYLGEVEFG